MDPSNYVLNPKTQRLIKKGGLTHKRLIKAGIVEKLKNAHEREIKEGEDVKKLKQEMELETPKHKKVMKIKNKLVQRDRSADEYFLNIIDQLLDDKLKDAPKTPPKLVRKFGKYKIRAPEPESSSDEESDEDDSDDD